MNTWAFKKLNMPAMTKIAWFQIVQNVNLLCVKYTLVWKNHQMRPQCQKAYRYYNYEKWCNLL